MVFKLIMFDLDGTLGYLEGDERVDQFLLRLYARKISRVFNIEEERVQKVLMDVLASIKATPKLPKTVSEVMFDEISKGLNIDESKLREVTDDFYENEFDEMKRKYKPLTGAREAVEAAFNLGVKVAIATDSVVRRVGVLKRLKWIGLMDYPYCFITSADDNHATKPHTYFYIEILDRCNIESYEAIMIGNRIKNDIIPAKKLGILTIHVKDKEDPFSLEADYNVDSISEIPLILSKIFST